MNIGALLAPSFLVSAALCWIIIRNSKHVLSKDHMLNDTSARQALHRTPTPRIGGVAVFVAFLAALLIQIDGISDGVLLALASGAIVFAVGLKEDFSRNVSPRFRLMAAFASAALAIYLTGATVDRMGLVQLDWFFGIFVISVLATLIWSAGTCHSLNLIDGLNGLSSSYTIVALIALNLVAGQTGNTDIQIVSTILIGALLGFFVFNWPGGKIFMGDAGAYALGHVLAWLCILLIAREPAATPLAFLLILFWPVVDTAFSMIRRKILKRAIDEPDRLHFHHIVVRVLGRLLRGRVKPESMNSFATIALIPMFALPAFTGAMLWDEPVKALVSLLVFLLVFLSAYTFVLDALATRRLVRRRSANGYAPFIATGEKEVSAYSGIFIQEGLAVDVEITKAIGADYWKMTVVADNATGRRWHQAFPSDREAWDTFMKAVKTEGMDSLVGPALRSST